MGFVWLATCAELPTGGDEDVLPALFAAAGVDADWARWDDPTVDWAQADLVAIRTTWDYTERLDDFLTWTKAVSARTLLVNPADVVAWNTDKRYLLDLDGWGLPVVPSAVATDRASLADALAPYKRAVVKPTVGIGGIGLGVWNAGDPIPAVPVDLVVQPLVESVRTRGEVSVFVMGGNPVSQVAKRPAVGEVRVHEEYGGVWVVEPLDDDTADLAGRAIQMVADRFSAAIPYGRVDLMWLDEQWVIGEVEITEPGLYVKVDPAIADAYVDAIAALVNAAP